MLASRSRTPVHAGQLDVLWLAAQLHSEGSSAMPFDVPERLDQAHRTLIDVRRPAWRSYLAWFEVYLALSANPPPAEVRSTQLLPARP
jgi:hypothetical protein